MRKQHVARSFSRLSPGYRGQQLSPMDTIDEFAFTRYLQDEFPATQNVHIGIGDDAAVLADGTIVTTDTLVEGSHFTLPPFTPWDVGWKSVIVNLSDIYAMGAHPTALLVTLTLPPATLDTFAKPFFDGIQAACRAYGAIPLVGGDTTNAGCLVVTGIALGKLAARAIPFTQDGAKPGDILCVTDSLGASFAGFHLLQSMTSPGQGNTPYTHPPLSMTQEDIQRLTQAHLHPHAARKAVDLLDNYRDMVHACTDISDGLASDARKLATKSKVSVVLAPSTFPLAEGIDVVCATVNHTAQEAALVGGEDFQLLLALDKGIVSEAQQHFADHGHMLASIGYVVAEKEQAVYLEQEGTLVPYEEYGWSLR